MATTTSAYEMDGVGAYAGPISAVSAINRGADQIAGLRGVAQANTAASADQAQILRDWQEAQNAKAMEFSAQQAAINRQWQEYMSNTAHQREVKDLLAAGLNPVLSAMNGNGAAVGSGATASGVTSAGAKGDVDMSLSGALANLFGSLLGASTQIEAANINAKTQEAVADKYTAMSQIVAEINKMATLGAAGIHAGASKYAADSSYAAAQYSATHNVNSPYGLVNTLLGDAGLGGVSGVVTSAKDTVKKATSDRVWNWMDEHLSTRLVDQLKGMFGKK